MDRPGGMVLVIRKLVSAGPAIQRRSVMQQEAAVRFAHAIEHRLEAKSSGGFRGEVDLAEALGLLKQAA